MAVPTCCRSRVPPVNEPSLGVFGAASRPGMRHVEIESAALSLMEITQPACGPSGCPPGDLSDGGAIPPASDVPVTAPRCRRGASNDFRQ